MHRVRPTSSNEFRRSCITVLGLPDATVQEARDRVRAAITHSGCEYPMQRITANLAPSDLRKQGSGLDLVLALGILAARDSALNKGLDGRLFCGELGLGGEVRAESPRSRLLFRTRHRLETRIELD